MLLPRLILLLGLAASSASADDRVSLSTLSDALARDDSKAAASLFLNQPAADETARFEARVKALNEHRNTKLGRVFFAILGAMPDVTNLAETAQQAWIGTRWPLPESGELLVHVSWRRKDGRWLLETLEINLLGAAHASFAAAGPYFGPGVAPKDVLDDPRIEKLLPMTALATTDGGFSTAVQEVHAAATGAGSREEKLAVLARHLDDAALAVLRAADEDKARRWALWDGLKRQWEKSSRWPQLSSVPEAAGARYECGYSEGGGGSLAGGSAWAARLASGKLGGGGEAAVAAAVTQPAPAPEKPAVDPGRGEEKATKEEKRHGKARKSN